MWSILCCGSECRNSLANNSRLGSRQRGSRESSNVGLLDYDVHVGAEWEHQRPRQLTPRGSNGLPQLLLLGHGHGAQQGTLLLSREVPSTGGRRYEGETL